VIVFFVGGMFSTSTQRKYWTFHEQAELEQLREEVNHQYVAKNGGGDMDADVCITTYIFLLFWLICLHIYKFDFCGASVCCSLSITVTGSSSEGVFPESSRRDHN